MWVNSPENDTGAPQNRAPLGDFERRGRAESPARGLHGSGETSQQASDQDHAARGGPKIKACLVTLYLSESLGARQLASVLKANGHHCSLIFFKEFRWGEFRHITSREEDLLFGLLGDIQPDLVGLSLTSSLVADVALDLSAKIRRRLDVPVILGGAHPSVAPEECLEHADIVCVGEGEGAIADLAEALASGRGYHDIPNLWTKLNGEIHRNDVRLLADSLDSLPFVSYGEADSYSIEDDRLEQLDPVTRIAMYHITASRMACPFNCTFCGAPWLRRHLYAGNREPRRYRSLDHVLAEINQARARNPNIKLIQFWDEIFAVRAPAGWLDEFCERFPREVGLPFGIWSHPSVLTDEIAKKLRGAGLKSVVMGVESGSQRVRRDVLNRRETDAAVVRAARILNRYRIEAGYDFIVDIPWLREENCRGTFELVMQLPHPFSLGIHSLSFLPKTAITERALAEGKIRPNQVSRADQPLAERFESHLWKCGLGARDRSSAFWHSLIYLASAPFIPRALLRRLRQLRPLLVLYPKPLVVAAEAARIRKETGNLKLWPALAAAYPGLAGFFARHPTFGRFVNRTARALGRMVLAAASLGRR